MNLENEFDELDKILFDYFESDKEIPISTQNIINNSLKDKNSKYNIYKHFARIAMFIISIVVIGSGAVFAEDIFGFVNSLFINSTQSIDTAVKNGFVQNEKMDFVYDNNVGIGIKVDSLIMDDKTLDISFEYKFSANNPYESIKLHEYYMREDDGRLIYDEHEGYSNEHELVYSCDTHVTPRKVNETTFNESIIYTFSENTTDIDKICFLIKALRVKKDGKEFFINGEWKFEIEINEKMLNRHNEFYKCPENKYIEEMSAELMETMMVIDIKFNSEIDYMTPEYREPSNLVIIDEAQNEYSCKNISVGNKVEDGVTKGHIHLEFNSISKYYENIDKLILHINMDKERMFNLEMIREK